MEQADGPTVLDLAGLTSDPELGAGFADAAHRILADPPPTAVASAGRRRPR